MHVNLCQSGVFPSDASFVPLTSTLPNLVFTVCLVLLKVASMVWGYQRRRVEC